MHVYCAARARPTKGIFVVSASLAYFAANGIPWNIFSENFQFFSSTGPWMFIFPFVVWLISPSFACYATETTPIVTKQLVSKDSTNKQKDFPVCCKTNNNKQTNNLSITAQHRDPQVAAESWMHFPPEQVMILLQKSFHICVVHTNKENKQTNNKRTKHRLPQSPGCIFPGSK